LVTGGTGFVGQRLVEMLVMRGASRVISFDIVPKPKDAWDHANINYVVGDITKVDQLVQACEGVDCVFHIAAAVGPFHPSELYERVNYHGTLNVIEACKKNGVPKLVMSSSPSTRFTGEDVDGLTEDLLPPLPLKEYMQDYAATKAQGEMACREACCPELLTVAVAPHQVYGPRDNLFMPNVLEAAGTERLRVFSCSRTGYGKNRVCFTHVDNYCHGLILAAEGLYEGSPILGKFYIVTDADTHPHEEGYAEFWDVIDEPIQKMGFPSIHNKWHLPFWFIMPIAYLCSFVGWLFGTKFKLNPFSVHMMTMHRWFDVSSSKRDFGYEPVIGFAEGWDDTALWFQGNWLPHFQDKGLTGLYSGSQKKIDIQAGKKTN
jgi:nucleoside-diphosphate-sugar epimerase